MKKHTLNPVFEEILKVEMITIVILVMMMMVVMIMSLRRYLKVEMIMI